MIVIPSNPRWSYERISQLLFLSNESKLKNNFAIENKSNSSAVFTAIENKLDYRHNTHAESGVPRTKQLRIRLFRCPKES
jgi:hypothetical protein